MEALKYRLAKPCYSNEEYAAVQRVLESGWLAEGKVTREFERQLAVAVGCKYAVAVSNCTVALTLALKAHRARGQVAVPDFTHPATVLAVQNAGCEPVLCDVDLDSRNIDGEVEAVSSVPVSWAGNPIQTYPYSNLIVEDAACSLGADGVGKYTSCFSFHPRKIVTTGEGGAVTTNSEHIATRIRSLKCFGVGGVNYRLNEVASALGLVQLGKLKWLVAKHRAMAHAYSDLLESLPVGVPVQKGGTYQTYAVLLEKVNRGRVIRQLRQKGIEAQVGCQALHLLPQFKRLPWQNGLVNSTVLHKRLLALPMAHDLSEEDQKFVVSELAKTLHH
jgi:dTDP-4-amino-4,6-dideoxygalactose transaminase